MPELFQTAQLSVHINHQLKTVQEIHMYWKQGGCVKKRKNFIPNLSIFIH